MQESQTDGRVISFILSPRFSVPRQTFLTNSVWAVIGRYQMTHLLVIPFLYSRNEVENISVSYFLFLVNPDDTRLHLDDSYQCNYLFILWTNVIANLNDTRSTSWWKLCEFYEKGHYHPQVIYLYSVDVFE